MLNQLAHPQYVFTTQQTPQPMVPSKLEKVIAPTAILTGYAYLATYIFQAGYALHFGIPIEYITIDTRTFLTMGAGLAFIALLIYQLLEVQLIYKHTVSDKIRQSAFAKQTKRTIYIMALSLIMWFLRGAQADEFIRINKYALILAAMDALPPIILAAILTIKQPKCECGCAISYIEYYERALESWRLESEKDKPLSVIQNAKTKRQKQLATYSLLIILSLVMAFSAGLGLARTQRSFYTTKDSHLLITRYGDNLVLQKFDNKTQTLTPSFKLCPIGKEDLSVEYIRIDDIKFKEVDGTIPGISISK